MPIPTLKQFVAVSPLRGWWPNDETHLSHEVLIRHLSNDAKPTVETWSEFLSRSQIGWLGKTDFWLWHQFSDEPFHLTEKKRGAMELVRNAAVAFQIAYPVGTNENGLFIILCEVSSNGLAPESMTAHPALVSTTWGRLHQGVRLDEHVLHDLVSGVQNSYKDGPVRAQNAISLLELGLQSTNLHMGLLLWVMGLDSLLMAGNPQKFSRRVCNLLGKDHLIFPPTILGQPKYRVGEIVSDLYELRSELAHGREVGHKFRQAVGFRDEDGSDLKSDPSSCQYREVLHECALFLLCGTLRKIFTEKLPVGEVTKWRALLENSAVADALARRPPNE